MEECIRNCVGPARECRASCSSVNEQGITNPALGKTLQGLLSGTDPGITFLQKVIPNFIGLAFIVGVLVFFFTFIWGAISWIMSSGDKAAVEGARSRITNAIVGLGILFSLYAIINIIETFFGTNIITLDIGVLKIE